VRSMSVIVVSFTTRNQNTGLGSAHIDTHRSYPVPSVLPYPVLSYRAPLDDLLFYLDVQCCLSPPHDACVYRVCVCVCSVLCLLPEERLPAQIYQVHHLKYLHDMRIDRKGVRSESTRRLGHENVSRWSSCVRTSVSSLIAESIIS
jgi:hypothetical protein